MVRTLPRETNQSHSHRTVVVSKQGLQCEINSLQAVNRTQQAQSKTQPKFRTKGQGQRANRRHARGGRDSEDNNLDQPLSLHARGVPPSPPLPAIGFDLNDVRISHFIEYVGTGHL